MDDLLQAPVEIKRCRWWVAAASRFCDVDTVPGLDATGTAACARHSEMAAANIEAIGGDGEMPVFHERLGPRCSECGNAAEYLLPNGSAFRCDKHIP